ncbi:UNVERIFIED_CONTAM: hypothetical protein Sradi_4546000 [Sesamum radiatum]|uniref:Transposase-associated domain-containing protein n=1 Tax=Sesamum radiatum TaxID=300843 RepID=A0AAW2N8I9_SESRA
MHENNLPNRASLTPEFEYGVTAFIKWVKSQHAYMDGEKIKYPCRKCKNEVFKTPNEVNFDLYMKGFLPEYYNRTSHDEERVQEYFQTVTVPPFQDKQTRPAPTEEGTSTHWGDATQIDWAQTMIFDVVGPAFCSSNYNQDDALDDGIRSYPTNAGPSSYYGGGPYNYVFGLPDRFHDVVPAA